MNYDQHGNRSQIITAFPITSTQNLNGTVTSYDLNTKAPLYNGSFREIELTVGNNVNIQTTLKILVDVEIK